MKFYLAALLALFATAAQAQQLPPNYIGRSGAIGTEVCITPVVTAGAYVAGQVVGGVIAFPNALLSSGTGRLQSVRLNFKSVQTLEFDVTIFTGQPTGAFTDHVAPAITASDALLAGPVIKLTKNYSGLGTHTVYGTDNITRGVRSLAGTTVYAVVTSVGTPTLASTSDMQLCIAWSQD